MFRRSVFDIAGPVMVGPSSSHTAGACKIGQFARALFHRTPQKATFYLHGSFGEVYVGHATDRALLGGIMKFKTRDDRLRESFEYADSLGLKYRFVVKDLGKDCHPNTVKIVLEAGKHKVSVVGASVGGGMIKITKINGFDVHLHGHAGKYKTLVVCHENNRRIFPHVRDEISHLGVRIVDVDASSYEDHMLHVFHLQGRQLLLREVMELENIPGVHFVRSLSKLPTD